MNSNRKYDVLFLIIFIWLGALTLFTIYLKDSIVYTMGHISEIYDMIADVYRHITNLLSIGVWL